MSLFAGNRAKGESQNGGNKKVKLCKFFVKQTFLTPWHPHLFCFLETPVLRFALLPYYHDLGQSMWVLLKFVSSVFLPNMSLYWLLGLYHVGLRFNLLNLIFFLLCLCLSPIFVFFNLLGCVWLLWLDFFNALLQHFNWILESLKYLFQLILLLIGFFYVFLLCYYFFCVLFQNFSLVSRFSVCIAGHILELLTCIDVIQGIMC